MKIRIKWVPASIYISTMLIIAAMEGLAGYASFLISWFLPLYALFSITYLAISWQLYAWNQEFSTNHPHKGESIRCNLRLSNDGAIPLCGGVCTFTMPGKHKELQLPVGVLPGTKRTELYEANISCPYRGTYIAGIESIHLTTPLGIIETEIKIMPQMFYVYPELCTLDASIEKYAISSGITIPGTGGSSQDSSIFEYIKPLRNEQPEERIAWKRWAATGVPAAIVTGQARSRGLTIVLDLYPCSLSGTAQNAVTEEDKLTAEDCAISAAFSVLQYLAAHEIPVRFIVGGSTTGKDIDSTETFKQLYDRSTSILFTDPAFPQAAFFAESTAILFSTRPLADLYHQYERALHSDSEPHLFLCPPPLLLETERERAELILEQRTAAGSHSLFYIADVKAGTREITNAFRV